MTRRSEMQHRIAEVKANLMARVANRLFTFRQDGLDGFLKRSLGPQKKNRGKADGERA